MSRRAGVQPTDADEEATTAGHAPVLLTESVSLLAPRAGGRYLDGTFGGGGHTAAILQAIAPDGSVLAIDADPAAEERARDLQRSVGDRLKFVQGNFRDLATIAREAGFTPLDGILLDLGLSSFQLDTPDRGFAFRHDGRLDMRFGPESGQSAADLIATLGETGLADLIWRLGEEPRSRQIARAIVRERELAPITTTTRLAEIVERAVGGRRGKPTHPATRAFQALRIAVNDELGSLEAALPAAVASLAPGGRLAVISFHSLEDRIVKQFMVRQSAECLCPPGLPICVCGQVPRLRLITRKPVKAGPDELATNPRSRSAVLRVAERLPDPGADSIRSGGS